MAKPRRAKVGAGRLRPYCNNCDKLRNTATVDWEHPQPRCRVCGTEVGWQYPPSPLRQPRKPVPGQQKLL